MILNSIKWYDREGLKYLLWPGWYFLKTCFMRRNEWEKHSPSHHHFIHDREQSLQYTALFRIPQRGKKDIKVAKWISQNEPPPGWKESIWRNKLKYFVWEKWAAVWSERNFLQPWLPPWWPGEPVSSQYNAGLTLSLGLAHIERKHLFIMFLFRTY